ncbi:MAG TPA: MoxR family ATPase, partial [Ilumatobacteraceae bacterium]|nr:MoxR family ATPase [Ilumatobacteraceae bacterium]
DQVLDVDTFLALQRSLEQVQVTSVIGNYVVDVVRATRQAPQLAVGASPRGTLAVLKLSRARAVIAGRDFVTPDDVRAVAVPALAHRVVLTADAWARGTDPREVVTAAISKVAAPSWQ